MTSSAVEWQLSYPAPRLGDEADFDAITSRLPDLEYEVLKAGKPIRFMPASGMTYDSVKGLNLTATERVPSDVLSHYSNLGYLVSSTDRKHLVAASPEIFAEAHVQLTHKYISAFFGIPQLHIAEPLWRGSSQICLTFKLSYILGMLARYFPTHWMSLVNGAKGDVYRALLLQSQNIVEQGFPTLVCEMISHKADQ